MLLRELMPTRFRYWKRKYSVNAYTAGIPYIKQDISEYTSIVIVNIFYLVKLPKLRALCALSG
jgi:hypothetical protein